ncbi:MAG: phenylalanine--tRNA ligase subunit alpha [Nitrososphaerota archaeon]
MYNEPLREELVLHPIEKRVLQFLTKFGPASFSVIAEKTGLDEGAIAKAAQWLASKNLVKVEESIIDKKVELGNEGKIYAEKGLPERRLVDFLERIGGEAELSDLKESNILSDEEIRIGVIWAKKNGWIEITRRGDEAVLELRKYPKERIDDEIVLQLLKGGGRSLASLGPYAPTCEKLSRRPGLIKVSQESIHIVTPTEKALKLGDELLTAVEEVSQLTPELISSGKWREVTFSRYNLFAPVKATFAARLHPLTMLIDMVKEAFVEMGFEEIRGPLVELAFWNFDALFQPQDHPAREMHDTFYLANPDRGEPPAKFIEPVRKTHEDGGETGSKGWGYKWSLEEASKLVLRTHTTATTIRYLSEHNEPPVRVFTVDRVYRNEKVDWKHLAELHQIEGILMDKSVTLRHLMGIIKEFYMRLGIRNVRFRPSYFPYTEPSAEVEVMLGESGRWTELGGMGIFRPEVTRPFGVKYPVLAWGLGLERLAMAVFNLNDIRELYRNDLSWIRSVPITFSTLKKERG